MKCRIMQQSDETSCGTCGLRWDTNDPAPPPCPNPDPKVQFPDAKATVFGPMALGNISIVDPPTSCYVVIGPFETTLDAHYAVVTTASKLKAVNKRKNKK